MGGTGANWAFWAECLEDGVFEFDFVLRAVGSLGTKRDVFLRSDEEQDDRNDGTNGADEHDGVARDFIPQLAKERGSLGEEVGIGLRARRWVRSRGLSGRLRGSRADDEVVASGAGVGETGGQRRELVVADGAIAGRDVVIPRRVIVDDRRADAGVSRIVNTEARRRNGTI